MPVHTLFVLPDDPTSVPVFMTEIVEHLPVLVLTPNAESAVMVATALGRTDVLAATSVGRASRVSPPAIVVGPPDVILGLVRRAHLKLGQLGAVVLAWVGAGPEMEALMADIPKDAARTIVATDATPEVEALVERYARRPRRVIGAAAPGVWPTTVRYVTVTPANRPAALRRLLDDLDPPSAIVYTRTDASERAVREVLNALGYAGAVAPVQVARGAVTETATLVVLYDLPLDANEVAAIVQSAPVEIIALERMPGAKPLTLSGPMDRARARVEELRRILQAGVPAAEATWLEPLLDAYDGIEIAAAAVHLLERERRPAVAPAAPAARESRPPDRRPPRDGPRQGPHDGPRQGPREGPRPKREEWTERGERLRHAKRPQRKNDEPPPSKDARGHRDSGSA